MVGKLCKLDFFKNTLAISKHSCHDINTEKERSCRPKYNGCQTLNLITDRKTI